jgi:hypothetical protein
MNGETQIESFGVGMVLPEGASIASFGAMTLCLRELPAVTVTGVGFRRAQGLRLERFSIRRADPHNMTGNSDQSLQDLGFPSKPVPVVSRCDNQARDPGPELAIQTSLDGDRPGEAVGLEVEYTSEGRRGTLTIPLELKVCPSAQPQTCGS